MEFSHPPVSETAGIDNEVNLMNKLLGLEIHPETLEIRASDPNLQRKSSENAVARDEDAPTVFVSSPSMNLICPLHKGVFLHPVLARCGHTFCRRCLVKHVDSNQYLIAECPVDRTLIRHDDLSSLIPNLVVVDSINELRLYCRHGLRQSAAGGGWVRDESGCPEVVPYGRRREHEDSCPFQTIPCPYSELCPSVRRMDLDQHLRSCSNVTCPNRPHGCSFRGVKPQVDQHLKACPIEGIRGYVERSQQKRAKLKRRLREKDDAMEHVTQLVQQLGTKIDVFARTVDTRLGNIEGKVRQLTTSLEGTQSKVDQIEALAKSIKGKERKVDAFPPAFPGNPALLDLKREHNLEIEQVNLNCRGTFTGHTGPVWALAASEDGVLVSGSADTSIKVWDVANFKCMRTILGHEGIVHAVVIAGRKLCSGSADCTIRIWEMESWTCTKVIRAGENTVCSLRHVGNFLLSGSYQEVKVWDLESYAALHTLTGFNHWVRAMAVADNKLYSGSHTSIKVWDVADNFKCVKTLASEKGSIYCLALTNNNRHLLSGTYNNVIHVYDLHTYTCIHALDGHIGVVYCLTASGNRFYSGSYDSTIKIWNSQNFKCLQTALRHTSSVDALVVTDKCLFSGSADHSVKVWM